MASGAAGPADVVAFHVADDEEPHAPRLGHHVEVGRHAGGPEGLEVRRLRLDRRHERLDGPQDLEAESSNRRGGGRGGLSVFDR